MSGVKALCNKLNEEFLTCQICLNIYKEPLLLTCQHSFCKSCVAQCVHSGTTTALHCPICRQKTVLPKKMGLGNLKKNFFLQSLIETLNARRHSQHSISPFDDLVVGKGNQDSDVIDSINAIDDRSEHNGNFDCENCELETKRKAVARCLDCTDFLCRNCELIHCQTKLTKKHKVVRLSELVSGQYGDEFLARAKIFCPRHVDEVCREICEDCFAVGCSSCLNEHHKDHKTRDLKDAVLRHKRRAIELLDYSSKEETRISESLEEVKKITENMKKEKKSVCDEIRNRTKSLIAAAKSYEEKCLKAVKSISKYRKASVNEIEEELLKKKSEIKSRRESLKEKLENVSKFGTPLEILELKAPTDCLEETTEMEEKSTNCTTSCTWSLSPPSDQSPSDFLNSIKRTLMQVIGRVECRGAKENFQNIDQFQDDADVISFVGRAQSVTSERTESDYCHMRTLLPLNLPAKGNIGRNVDKPILDKAANDVLSPTTAESPSLTMMRKFPPSTKKEVSRAHSMNGRSRCKIPEWKERSKSAERFLDDNTFASVGNSQTRPRSEYATTSRDNPASRGRERIRSRPSGPKLSTSLSSRNIFSPGGSDDSLFSLATSPVAALAENPARLGVYDTQDPTSKGAVASLASKMASAPSLDDINGSWSPSPGSPRTHAWNSDNQNNNIFIRSFQVNGKVKTFKSAPKLAHSASGHLLATDYKAQRVFVFSQSGDYQSSLKTKGSKNLHPISVVSTKKNKFLVACGEAVYKFNAGGKISKKLGSGKFSKCCAIAVYHKTNKLFVTDIDKRSVSILNMDGGLENIFGCDNSQTNHQTPDSESSLQVPYFIAVDPRAGNIFVSDWASNNVKVFDQDGNYLLSLSSCVSNSTPFSPTSNDVLCNPAGVACDDRGNIFVSDYGNHRVAMFDNNWQFRKFVATEKDGLQNPWSLVTTPNSKVVVSEYWSRTIKEFSY
ncbi:uncharacterized protein LOC143449442 [Clavelina lepadiformis]|uniref:uncharacterized protein LOC143449442 n=1 Tax=Clavelina lepadiformis TaxID=159417 RepID=UPI004040EBE0